MKWSAMDGARGGGRGGGAICPWVRGGGGG